MARRISHGDFSDLDQGLQDEADEAPAGFGRPKAHTAANYPRVDFTNPSQFRTSVRHVSNVFQAGTPEEHEAGKLWYPKVHEAVEKGIKGTGLSHMAGSGLVAAVSPQMDWDKSNIGAFGEMRHLGSKQWDTIRKSAESQGGPYHVRSGEATRVLQGMELSRASDNALVKAHRILQGEDPEEVLNRRTSPKTNSFMHNIHEPSGSPHVTIDYRAHDIAANRMYPTQFSGRGISSAGLKKGKSRYENIEDVYREAASAHGLSPTEMQASTWTTAKRLEHDYPTRSGKPRVHGVPRHGQPYL